jgi:hypothetical protein
MKISRNNSHIMKVEAEQNSIQSSLRDLQIQFQDYNRNMMNRMGDIDARMSELNSKFDSALNQQSNLLKNIEGDNIKNNQLLEGKTRSVSVIYEKKNLNICSYFF